MPFPKLDITYHIADEPPITNLVGPTNNSIDTDGNISFTCNTTDDYQLSNITFYWDYFGGWQANETVSINGTSDQVTFTKTNPDELTAA